MSHTVDAARKYRRAKEKALYRKPSTPWTLQDEFDYIVDALNIPGVFDGWSVVELPEDGKYDGLCVYDRKIIEVYLREDSPDLWPLYITTLVHEMAHVLEPDTEVDPKDGSLIFHTYDFKEGYMDLVRKVYGVQPICPDNSSVILDTYIQGYLSSIRPSRWYRHV